MPFVGVAQVYIILSIEVDDSGYVQDVQEAMREDAGPNASVHLRQDGEVAVCIICHSRPVVV